MNRPRLRIRTLAAALALPLVVVLGGTAAAHADPVVPPTPIVVTIPEGSGVVTAGGHTFRHADGTALPAQPELAAGAPIELCYTGLPGTYAAGTWSPVLAGVTGSDNTIALEGQRLPDVTSEGGSLCLDYTVPSLSAGIWGIGIFWGPGANPVEPRLLIEPLFVFTVSDDVPPSDDDPPPPGGGGNWTPSPTPTPVDPEAPIPPNGPSDSAELARISESQLRPGQTVTVSGTGFEAGEQVQLVLYSEPVVIASYPAEANGRVTAEFRVPRGFEIGEHTAELTGWQSGHVQNVRFTVVSPATAWGGEDSALWVWWIAIAGLLAAAAVAALVWWLRSRAPRPGLASA